MSELFRLPQLPPAKIMAVEPDEYHELQGFSPSTAHALLSSCALKAHDKYERNLGDEEDEDSDDVDDERVAPEKQKRLDRGNVMHALMLGKGKRIEVIPKNKLAKNGAYATNESKALRDKARAEGRIPVKEPDMEAFERVVGALRTRLGGAGHQLDGRSELAIEWWEPTPHGPLQCKTMIDHVVLMGSDGCGLLGDPLLHLRAEDPRLRPARARVFEIKFPDEAEPGRSERTSQQLGYEIACAARHRALDALLPSLANRIEYRYLFCEARRPYAFWDPTPTGSFLELGGRKWRTAVVMWAAAIKTGRWHSYHEDIMRRQIDLLRWVKVQEGFDPNE